jgi:hypothetical protein
MERDLFTTNNTISIDEWLYEENVIAHTDVHTMGYQ